jgi:hypothetical protein
MLLSIVRLLGILISPLLILVFLLADLLSEWECRLKRGKK